MLILKKKACWLALKKGANKRSALVFSYTTNTPSQAKKNGACKEFFIALRVAVLRSRTATTDREPLFQWRRAVSVERQPKKRSKAEQIIQFSPAFSAGRSY